MTARQRKIVGCVVIVAVAVIYPMFAMALADSRPMAEAPEALARARLHRPRPRLDAAAVPADQMDGRRAAALPQRPISVGASTQPRLGDVHATAEIQQGRRRAADETFKRARVLKQAVDRNARQGVHMVDVHAVKHARARGDRGQKTEFARQRKFALTGAGGVAHGKSEMTRRLAEAPLQFRARTRISSRTMSSGQCASRRCVWLCAPISTSG